MVTVTRVAGKLRQSRQRGQWRWRQGWQVRMRTMARMASARAMAQREQLQGTGRWWAMRTTRWWQQRQWPNTVAAVTLVPASAVAAAVFVRVSWQRLAMVGGGGWGQLLGLVGGGAPLKLGYLYGHALCTYFVGNIGRPFKHSTIVSLPLVRSVDQQK